MKYVATPEKNQTTLSVTIQEVAKNMSFIILSLLSFRGLIEFFEANQQSRIGTLVTFITEPLVGPFYQLFPPENSPVSLATFAAILAISALGGVLYIIAGSIHRLELLKAPKPETLPTFKQKKTA